MIAEMIEKTKFLLHICCAPCSTHVLNLLMDRHEVVACYYNPNIHPEKEYLLRLGESERYCRERRIPLLHSEYLPETWFQIVSGHEKDREGGERCALCFRMRLDHAARLAAAEGFDIFGTTLTVSPHKDAALINRIGMEAGARHGIGFHQADFKKGDGFGESCRLSREGGLYRQRYCGCMFSMGEG